MLLYSYSVSNTCRMWNNSVIEINMIGSTKEIANKVKTDNIIRTVTVFTAFIRHSFRHAIMSFIISVKDLKHSFDLTYFIPNVPIL